MGRLPRHRKRSFRSEGLPPLQAGSGIRQKTGPQVINRMEDLVEWRPPREGKATCGHSVESLDNLPRAGLEELGGLPRDGNGGTGPKGLPPLHAGSGIRQETGPHVIEGVDEMVEGRPPRKGSAARGHSVLPSHHIPGPGVERLGGLPRKRESSLEAEDLTPLNSSPGPDFSPGLGSLSRSVAHWARCGTLEVT